MNRLIVLLLLQINYSLSEFELTLFACCTGFHQGILAFVAAASAHTGITGKQESSEIGGLHP